MERSAANTLGAIQSLAKSQANGGGLLLRFNVLRDFTADAILTEGKGSETQAVREMRVLGQATVEGCFYGQNYRAHPAD